MLKKNRVFFGIISLALVLFGFSGHARASFFDAVVKLSPIDCEILLILGGVLSFCSNKEK